MQTAYPELRDRRRLEHESTLIKSYILEAAPQAVEADPRADKKGYARQLASIFAVPHQESTNLRVMPKDEDGFYELKAAYRDHELTLYLDTITNQRFWLGFSLSSSQLLDAWLDAAIQANSRLDHVWFWPAFLESVQKRGLPRGFGLDYDYRKFERSDADRTTYLKMQLWGGDETAALYNLLKTHQNFSDKVVLSKVRLKEFGDQADGDLFAIQDVKYTGKFTTRGTDLSAHLATLTQVRNDYEKQVRDIEEKYALRWAEAQRGHMSLEGFAIHFVPQDFLMPVRDFCQAVFDGTAPFRLVGFLQELSDEHVIADVVDLHTGGELSFEVSPDLITAFLPAGACGNSILRFYTNLQHHFNVRFIVKADNGDLLF